MESHKIAESFFTDYAAALMDRDADAVAAHYAVPALILFPGQAIAVSDASQTREFFQQAWGQYEGITDTSTEVEIVAATSSSIWADVAWTHDSGSGERLMYQLVHTGEGWRIAVLTPLE